MCSPIRTQHARGCQSSIQKKRLSLYVYKRRAASQLSPASQSVTHTPRRSAATPPSRFLTPLPPVFLSFSLLFSCLYVQRTFYCLFLVPLSLFVMCFLFSFYIVFINTRFLLTHFLLFFVTHTHKLFVKKFRARTTCLHAPVECFMFISLLFHTTNNSNRSRAHLSSFSEKLFEHVRH